MWLIEYVQANFESGAGNPIQKNEQVNYFPSSVEHTDEKESDVSSVSNAHFTGQRQRSDYGTGKENIIGDDYKQPGDRIRSFSKETRDNLLHHLVSWITDPKVRRKKHIHSEHFLHVNKVHHPRYPNHQSQCSHKCVHQYLQPTLCLIGRGVLGSSQWCWTLVQGWGYDGYRLVLK